MILYSMIQLCRQIHTASGFTIGIVPIHDGEYQLLSRFDPTTGHARDDYRYILDQFTGLLAAEKYLKQAKETVLLREGALLELASADAELPTISKTKGFQVI